MYINILSISFLLNSIVLEASQIDSNKYIYSTNLVSDGKIFNLNMFE